MRVEPPASVLMTGHPYTRKAIPKPKLSASSKERSRKNGSSVAEGVVPGAGGQMICPVRNAGMVNSSVTKVTLSQRFIVFSFCFRELLICCNETRPFSVETIPEL